MGGTQKEVSHCLIYRIEEDCLAQEHNMIKSHNLQLQTQVTLMSQDIMEGGELEDKVEEELLERVIEKVYVTAVDKVVVSKVTSEQWRI
jgi:hypothetical protein